MRRFRFSTGLAATVLVAGMAAATGAKADDVVYNTIASPLPPSQPSLGYQATQTTEVGDYITLAPGSSQFLTTATVTMTNWATEAQYAGTDTAGVSGFVVPITLSLYNAVGGGLTPTVGSLISSTTINASISWRPPADASCGSAYMSGGTCYNGQNVNITFDINKAVPSSFIYGVSFNTQSAGDDPTGVNGPYNSLNFALASTGPTVGTDVDPDSIYLNSKYGPYLTGPAGTFGPQSDWTPYTPAVQFAAVPEPASMALLGAGLFSLMMIRRRKQS